MYAKIKFFLLIIIFINKIIFSSEFDKLPENIKQEYNKIKQSLDSTQQKKIFDELVNNNIIPTTVITNIVVSYLEEEVETKTIFIKILEKELDLYFEAVKKIESAEKNQSIYDIEFYDNLSKNLQEIKNNLLKISFFLKRKKITPSDLQEQYKNLFNKCSTIQASLSSIYVNIQQKNLCYLLKNTLADCQA